MYNFNLFSHESVSPLSLSLFLSLVTPPPFHHQSLTPITPFTPSLSLITPPFRLSQSLCLSLLTPPRPVRAEAMASRASSSEVYFSRGGVQNASRTSGIVEYDASEARKNARKGYTPRHTQPLKVRHEEDAQRMKERERERE